MQTVVPDHDQPCGYEQLTSSHDSFGGQWLGNSHSWNPAILETIEHLFLAYATLSMRHKALVLYPTRKKHPNIQVKLGTFFNTTSPGGLNL
jgi:hypothetical protein